MQIQIEGLEDYFIPLPPNIEVAGREVIGIMPCHRKDCDQWGYVTKANTNDDYYPTCGSHINAHGCKKLQPHYLRSDFPDQTIEIAQERLSYLDPQSDYSFLIQNAWKLERPADVDTTEETTADSTTTQEVDNLKKVDDTSRESRDSRADEADTGSDKADIVEPENPVDGDSAESGYVDGEFTEDEIANGFA